MEAVESLGNGTLWKGFGHWVSKTIWGSFFLFSFFWLVDNHDCFYLWFYYDVFHCHSTRGKKANQSWTEIPETMREKLIPLFKLLVSGIHHSSRKFTTGQQSKLVSCLVIGSLYSAFHFILCNLSIFDLLFQCVFSLSSCFLQLPVFLAVSQQLWDVVLTLDTLMVKVLLFHQF